MTSAPITADLIAEQKREMRRVMKERRAGAALAAPEAAIKLRDQFLKHIELPPRRIVSAYAAMGDEIDPAPLIEALRLAGHRFALPVVVARDAPLIFRAYAPGDATRPGSMGIAEPLSSAAIVEPDVLLVPLLAFDKHGYRLGYGAGYYDRTLNSLRARKQIIAVGLAFAAQEVPLLPRNGHDARLDKIVTEIQVLSP